MFRKGFKTIFLVLCLMFVSSIVFVACKETKVKVSSVAFKETENITMIVGQTYMPEVNVLPSYASNKGYYFVVESNQDVVRISNNSIVALKEGVAQLKVISSENEYLTDIIAVKVLPTAINLKAPTNLNFDGEKFSFGAVSNATSYFIKINNEEEIELGNSTSYSIAQYQAQSGTNAFDKVLNVKVRAVGDERITVPSDYSDVISVLKISAPKDVKIENNVLSFSKIKNVGKYKLEFYTSKSVLLSLDLVASEYSQNKIEIELSEHKELFTGGQYFCKLICSNEDYVKVDNEKVISSNQVVVTFDVLSKPKNLVISDYILYWDAVLGANSYTLLDANDNVLQNNITVTNINLKDLGLTNGSYSYKLVANSNQSINVVSGMNISDIVSIRVLEKPTVSVANKTITWNDVEGATSYILTIYKSGIVVNSLNLVTNSYSVASFTKGDYSFEIYSCGDNKQTLTSLDCTTGTFKVLAEATNLRVENKQILWDSAEGTNFNISIIGENVEINKTTDTKKYDISDIIFESGKTYTVTVGLLGENNVFDSKTVSTTFYKLKDIENVAISNKSISFLKDSKTTSVDIKLYNSRGQELDVLTLSGNKYLVDDSSLPVGEYTVEMFAYGNNGNVLDPNNTAESRFLKIRKLGTSSLAVDTAEFKVYKTQDVDYAVSYELYQNGSKVASFTNTETYKHDVSNFAAGDYEFKIKALGNNKEILDGVMSDTSIKVLKLDTPKLAFNTSTLTYTITTNEAQDKYVASYDFNVNGESIDFPTSSKILDCSSLLNANGEYLFNAAGAYVAELRLLAVEISNEEDESNYGYNLIMNSDLVDRTDTKINSTASLEVKGGKIIIKPESASSKYTPIISIGYKENNEDPSYTYVEYKDATYDSTEKGYVFNVYDENYNVTGPKKADGSCVFAEAGTFDFKLTLEGKGYITSNVYENFETVSKLEKVTNILKVSTPDATDKTNIAPSEKITFNTVDGASKYILRMTKQKTSYSTEIDAGTSSLTISEIKDLFDAVKKNWFKEGNTYYLEIIAVGNNDNESLTSVASDEFMIQLIKCPFLKIESNKLYITDDMKVAEKTYITCTDSKNNNIYEMLELSNGEAVLELSSIKGLSTGVITIAALFESSNGNVFESSTANILERDSSKKACYTQLNQPVLSVGNGLLKWEANENARAYSLKYTNKDGQTEEFTLSSGSANFNIVEETVDQKVIFVASFELKGVEVGTSAITVQSLGKGWVSVTDPETEKTTKTFYYDSPVSDEVRITKLSQPTIEVKNGKIYIELNSAEYNNVKSVKINGKDISTYTTLGQSMEVNGYDLLNYNSDKVIEEETFTVSVQAKTVEGSYILNPEDCVFTAKGLKAVNNIRIQTRYDSSSEIIEKIDTILWDAVVDSNGNELNNGLVSGYYIQIVHNGEVVYKKDISNQTSYTFPSIEGFGAGNYTISIRTLTNEAGYVHSEMSASLTVTVCEQPKNLRTQYGVVVWDKVTGANEYVVRIYDKDDNFTTVEVTKNEFDFSCLRNYDTGLYKLKLFAMNKNDSKIVAGTWSDLIELYRVPEITKYKVEEGNLYLYTHSYASKVELKLTLNTDSKVVYDYELDLEQVLPSGGNWSEMSDLDSYLSKEDVEEGKVGWRYCLVGVKDKDNDTMVSILNMLNGRYTLEVKAIGNSTEIKGEDTVAKLSTVNSKVTTVANNLNNEYKVDGTDTNYVQKIVTPNIEITKRGVISFGLDTTYTNCKYYELNGLLIYEVNLSVGATDYSFYAVDNYYIGCVDASMVHVYDKSIENCTYYGYIKYEYETGKYLYLNILRYKESETSSDYIGNLEIDFNADWLYFVNKFGDEENNGAAETTSINLTEGGNFKVSVSILGDDTVFLTSNTTDAKNVIRYRKLDLYVVNGYLTWDNLKEGDDSPIYLLRITNGGKESLVYIHDKGITLDPSKLPEVTENTYYVTANTDSAYLTYMLDTWGENDYIFGGGSYSVTITTYYSDKTDNSRLEARTSAKTVFEKLASPEISIESGKIKWNQIKVGTENIQNYQVQLSGGNLGGAITFKISQNISGEEISYLLPQTITDIDGNQHTLEGGVENYIIQISAEDAGCVNSNMSNTLTFGISDYVSGLKMENGKLVWSWGEENSEGSYEIKINIYKKDGTLLTTCTTTVSSKSYDLSSNLNDIDGNGVSLTSDYSYEIFVKRLGDSQTLTGFYKDSVNTERLKAVDYSSITSDKEILTWSKITSLDGSTDFATDVNYVIEFVGTTLENVTIKNATSFDFSGYTPGKYKIKITPKSSGYFVGNTTREFVVYKLEAVGAISNPQINNVNNILQWNAVYVTDDSDEKIYAEKYEIEIYDAESERLVLKTDVEDKTGYVEDKDKPRIVQLSLAEQESVNNLKVRIRAVMTSETGNVINAEWSDYTSFTRAESISSEYFVVNEEKLRFEWRAIENEQNNDGYILKYSYKTSKDSSDSIQKYSLTVTNSELITVIDDEGKEQQVKLYYYIPSVIGYYTEISVTVNRGSNLSSETVVMKKDGTVAEYTFDKFASGEGTEASPYIIETVEHLQHIKIFPDKHFKLNNDLDLTGINEMLINGEFTGSFDGGGFTLSNYTLESSDSMVGMFRSLNGATIKNLKINYATIIISNTYNRNISYGGILAGKATESTITNVNITYSLVNVVAEDEGKWDDNSDDNSKPIFYYGGMFGYIDSTTISNCNIQLGYIKDNSYIYTSLTFTGSNSDNVYYGGVAGYAVNSTFTGPETKSTVKVYYEIKVNRIPEVTYYPNVYFGGVFGAMNNSNVTYAEITLNQSEEWQGELIANAGVCGCIVITDVEDENSFSNLTIKGTIYNNMCNKSSALFSVTNVQSYTSEQISENNITKEVVISYYEKL